MHEVPSARVTGGANGKANDNGCNRKLNQYLVRSGAAVVVVFTEGPELRRNLLELAQPLGDGVAFANIELALCVKISGSEKHR